MRMRQSATSILVRMYSVDGIRYPDVVRYAATLCQWQSAIEGISLISLCLGKGSYICFGQYL